MRVALSVRVLQLPQTRAALHASLAQRVQPRRLPRPLTTHHHLRMQHSLQRSTGPSVVFHIPPFVW